MITDLNRTVYAFYSQQFTENDPYSGIGIFFNQWTLKQGWTEPTDIFLPPSQNTALIMSAILDQNGKTHIIFWSGNEFGAEIYYSQNQSTPVGNGSNWSKPVDVGESASSPGNAALAVDNDGNLIILYGGNRNGNGIYVTTSKDGGSTWSDASPIYLTGNSGLLTSGLQAYLDDAGWLHAVWFVPNLAGQGRAVYYARLNVLEGTWSDPIVLGTAEEGFGILYPAVIKYQNHIFALFNATPKIIMRRSSDNGQTWTDPVAPFPQHFGVNGSLSLVIDGANNLHLFFGQRITGNPDIHGMWHSIWQNGSWSSPEAVVSGPRVMSGDNNSFDPYNASAIVSQGDILMVTWRTDPGNGLVNENGVWYSITTLDAPVTPLQPVSNVQNSSTPDPASENTLSTPVFDEGGSGRIDLPIPSPTAIDLDVSVSSSTNPLLIVGIGMIPVILLIIVSIIILRINRLNR